MLHLTSLSSHGEPVTTCLNLLAAPAQLLALDCAVVRSEELTFLTSAVRSSCKVSLFFLLSKMLQQEQVLRQMWSVIMAALRRDCAQVLLGIVHNILDMKKIQEKYRFRPMEAFSCPFPSACPTFFLFFVIGETHPLSGDATSCTAEFLTWPVYRLSVAAVIPGGADLYDPDAI